MITTRILGGLGNQFFQYAIGRRLALAEGSTLRLDVSSFKTYFRSYLLNRFTIQAELLSETEAASCQRFRQRSSPAYWFERFKPMTKRRYREERPADYFHYKPEYLAPIAKPLYLAGYWQHAEYLEPIREQLLTELSLLPEYAIPAAHPLLQKLTQTEIAAVHFRRGDYAKTMHGILDQSYYVNALKELLKQKPKIELYVFSNDIDWVKEQVAFEVPVTYVSEEHGLEDYQEFDLMRRCQHQIIANSTYSWWAAWLNQYPEKLLFAPKRWLQASEQDASAIIPPTWKLI